MYKLDKENVFRQVKFVLQVNFTFITIFLLIQPNYRYKLASKILNAAMSQLSCVVPKLTLS